MGPPRSGSVLDFQHDDDVRHLRLVQLKPNVTRLKSVIGHSMFGSGMYLTARLMEALG
jgi:hypothetical protein